MKAIISGVVLATTIGLAGCGAPVTEAELAEKARVATADVLGLDPAVAVIDIASVQRGPTSSSWSAKYEGDHLVCSGNENFLLPDCRVAQETASN